MWTVNLQYTLQYVDSNTVVQEISGLNPTMGSLCVSYKNHCIISLRHGLIALTAVPGLIQLSTLCRTLKCVLAFRLLKNVDGGLVSVDDNSLSVGLVWRSAVLHLSDEMSKVLQYYYSQCHWYCCAKLCNATRCHTGQQILHNEVPPANDTFQKIMPCVIMWLTRTSRNRGWSLATVATDNMRWGCRHQMIICQVHCL